MKLKTGLQIGALFPIVMGILIALGLVLRSQELDKVGRSLVKANALSEKISVLYSTSHEYIITPADDTETAWNASYSDLTEMLESVEFDELLQDLCVERMRGASKTARNSFSFLSSRINVRVQKGSGALPLSEREEELSRELSRELTKLTSEIFNLSKISHENAARKQREADYVVMHLFGILALIMAVAILIAGRRIIKRFASIRRGMGAVSTGDFNHEVEVAGNDELDELSGAFNSMSYQLKQSHSQLTDEIEKHEKVAEALRKSNMMMSDALIKLKRAQTRIIDSERLNALKQMTRGLTHDFNSTLTPILGLSDFLLLSEDSLANKEQATELITAINQAAIDARAQVRRLSDFFRPEEETDTEDVDIKGLVDEVVAMLEPRWKAEAESLGISITMQTRQGPVPPLRANRIAVRDALISLMLNAIDSISKSGQITISSESDESTVIITVEDNGCGMNDEVKNRCLEPFFSAKGSDHAGMGLTNASATVRRHEGTLAVETTDGKGTIIRMHLPIPGDRKSTAEDEEAQKELPRIRFLVIDDDVWVHKVFQKAFTAEGHTVAVAASGEEGLKLFEEQQFDLVIVDRAMPRMNGDVVAAKLKKIAPTMPIILLTGFGDVMKDEGEEPENIDLVLSKPATLKEIRQAMRSVLQ